jgi:para-aminobenzoate synthetase component 1
MLAAVAALPRPLVFLEGGAGKGGTVRLAWGAQRRCRVPWGGDPDQLWRWIEAGRGPVYGLLGYEAGLPSSAQLHRPDLEQPFADFFEPEHEIVVDDDADRVVGGDIDVLPDADPPEPDGNADATIVGSSLSQSSFAAAVLEIKNHIAAGDVYQVNLAVAQRFQFAGSGWDVYLRLRRTNPSPWMGFADFGDWQIASSSPELLVEVHPDADGRTVRSRPIAGTRKKTGDRERDRRMRRELRLSEKERAEHLMLVDLARNDIGRVARFGSVAVREREVIEEYSHVFHLVSEVRGRLRDECRMPEVLQALFPGGTITGAPKIRAMEVIADLEPVARGAYTGGLGWVNGDRMQFNILIRSAVIRDGQALVQSGAGIVWDSDPVREWRESLRKGAAVRAALGAAD